MSRPRFLADEELRREIVRATLRLEPSVEFETAIDLGLDRTDDDKILEFAASNGWLLISHDVNTMKAAAESRIRRALPMHGLFLAPQNRATRPVAESIVLIWASSEADEWRNKIVYLPL